MPSDLPTPPDPTLLVPLLARLGEHTGEAAFLAGWLANYADAGGDLTALGARLSGDGAPEAARAAFDAAARQSPDDPVACHNLGVVLQQLGDFEAAAEAFCRAAALPANAQPLISHLGQAVAYRQAGRLDEAIALLEGARQNGHDSPDLRWNLSLCYLNAGRFDLAWPLYEARHERPDKPSWAIMDEAEWPMWRGEPLAGKRVLVVGEQGLGDQIQFAALLPRLVAAGAAVEMLVSPGLSSLFAGQPGVDAVHEVRPRGRPFDYWVYLLSLPGRLGLTTPATLVPPPPAPPLAVDRKNGAKILAEIDRRAGARPRVGLVWAGNPAHGNDRFRSMPLDLLGALLALDVCWVGLQRDIPARDNGSPWLARLYNPAPAFRSLAETAAVMEALDLIITIDSAPAHLAARLGRPTWVFLPQNVDWRWPRQGETTFWYPTMRLFHQTRQGDWTRPVARVRHELARRLNTPGEFDARA